MPPAKVPTTEELFKEVVELLLKDRGFTQVSKIIAGQCKQFSKVQNFEELLLRPLLAAFTVAALCDRDARESRRPSRPDWSANSGMTKKSLRGMPQRIRRMATALETINKAPYLNLEGWIKYGGQGQSLVLQLQSLPKWMRIYADMLSHCIKQMAYYNKLKPGDLRVNKHDPELRISEYVRFLTGRHHDRRVTDLLEAATTAVGQEFDWFDGTLARVRYKRKAAKHRPKLPKNDR